MDFSGLKILPCSFSFLRNDPGDFTWSQSELSARSLPQSSSKLEYSRMNAGDLDKAAELLRRGKKRWPHGTAALLTPWLSFHCAGPSGRILRLEKAKHRSEARQVAQALVSRDRRSSYPFHTMIKSQIDEFGEIPPMRLSR